LRDEKEAITHIAGDEKGEKGAITQIAEDEKGVITQIAGKQ
jgi:hypothetical protein